MIRNLKAYPSFDSLGGHAVMVRAFTDNGSYSASVPVETDLKRLLNAFSSVRPNFIGLDEGDLKSLDAFAEELLEREKPLALAISLAVARSGSENNLWKLGTGRDFPFLLANVISNKEMQEFFIIPHRAKDPIKAVNTCLEAYNSILEEMKREKRLAGRSPDGSWFCNMDLLKTLEFLYSLAEDWDLRTGVDFSGPGLWDRKTYKIGPKEFAPPKYMDFLEEISFTYKIYYLEDPFHSEDFSSISGLTSRLAKKLVIGNKLYQSQKERLKKGLELKSGNGIVIRPAQAGTLSDIINISGLAREGGFYPIVSQNPGGETGDSWLADLSIACNAPLMKIGLSGSERLGKLNRLIELWHEVPDARMAELP